MSNDKAIDRIGSKIGGMILGASDKVMENRVIKVRREIDRLQDQFFLQLAQKTIDAQAAPNLGVFTPTWKGLAPVYATKKKKQGKGFYNYSGKLKQSLLRSKAVTAFGRPLISLGSGGRFRNQNVYVQNNRARTIKGKPIALDSLVKNKSLQKSIIVDLYPRLTESLKQGRINEGKYFSDKIAIKMTNYRGGRDRPILKNYMNWWLEVKAKEAVRRGLR